MGDTGKQRATVERRKSAHQSLRCWHPNFRWQWLWQCLPQLLWEPWHQSQLSPLLSFLAGAAANHSQGLIPLEKVALGDQHLWVPGRALGAQQWVLLSSEAGTGVLDCHCPCPPLHLSAVLILEAKAQKIPECLTGHWWVPAVLPMQGGVPG